MPISTARLRISDYNKKRKSNLKREEKRIQVVSLSLTSMVDMFAILVIYLLTNTSTVTQWIEVGHGIELPTAQVTDPPPKAATLHISKDEVFGDKDLIGTVAQVKAGAFAAVKGWLSKVEKKGGYVNIVADRDLPFGLVKQLVGVCQDSGYNNVNLAVQPQLNKITAE